MGQTQKVEVTRTCDVCSTSVVLIQPVTHEQLADAGGWYVISKEHLLDGDQLAPIAKLACSQACALSLINGDALELPTQQKNVLEFGKVN